jgi:inhibitor of KinA sporulation pathway (predicted exonuclease)
MRDTNYFSLDLELNNKNDGTTPRIIQVGIAWGSPIRPEEIKTHSWYLDPEENITPFITELTGITDEIIKEKSVSHETVAEELGKIIRSYDCFVNPICWGGSGFSSDASELKEEFNQRSINFPFFGRRIFDVKTLYVFQQMTSGRNSRGGLKSALSRNKLEFIGEPHRASDDAFNTLRLFFHYINRYKKLQKMLQDLKDTF